GITIERRRLAATRSASEAERETPIFSSNSPPPRGTVVAGSLREEPAMANVTELNVNGQKKPIDADGGRTLLSVLRDDLGLTGSKYGRGEGKCGACTVLIDGQSTRSCVTRVGTLAGNQVHTIESLSADTQLHPIQEPLLER